MQTSETDRRLKRCKVGTAVNLTTGFAILPAVFFLMARTKNTWHGMAWHVKTIMLTSKMHKPDLT